MAQTFRKWHKINQICETSGERKIFPSANPASDLLLVNSFNPERFSLLLNYKFSHQPHLRLMIRK